MKLHSDILTSADIREALKSAKDAGLVDNKVYFEIFTEAGSRSRKRAWEIQLGCTGKTPGTRRGWKNTGTRGADSGAYGCYAATYDEWGWFIAELYTKDENAIFGAYKGYDDFLVKTRYAYDL